MKHLTPREGDHFHNQSSNQPNPLHNYIDRPSITRAQLTPKPPRRDVSLSTYLKPNDTLLSTEANHPGHRAQDSEISIFEAEKYFNGAHEPNNKNTNGVYSKSKSKQPEIPTIGRLSLSTPKQSVSSVSRLSSVSDDSYGRNYRARSFHATPTASSEASWNSQTGLLTNPPGLAPVSIRNLPSAADRTSKKSGASMNWFLRGNICPCSGKKSVNVKASNSESETSKIPPTPPRIVQLNRISSSGGSGGYLYSSSQSSPSTTRATLIPDQPMNSFIARPQLEQSKLILTSTNPKLNVLHREQSFPPNRVAGGGGTGNGFTFPILSNKVAPSNRTLNIVQPPIVVTDGGVSAGETPRDSIEIFQPRESPKSRRASYDDEICSDASSDLFEIESFSTTTGTQTTLFPRRDSLDDPSASFNVRRLRISAFNKSAVSSAGLAEEDVDEPVTPSIAPTECYAPSEVSVDWSVTTAEGFDRASLAGFSELGYAALRHPAKGGSGADDIKRKGNGGLLTSCRCEKAVNVGPNPIKYQTEIRPTNTTRSRSQAPIRVNGVTSTDNNVSHSHGVTRSTLMPVPFVAESLAHRHSL